MTEVKICGLRELETLKTAISAGARFIGFVFYPDSPRNIAPEQAKLLAQHIPTSVRSVGLFVDPSDEELEYVLGIAPLDMVQLHGAETPERIEEIKRRTLRPVIKAISVGAASDLASVNDFEEVSDWLLFDAKMPASQPPGGGGKTFDWALLKNLHLSKPWMLSGGLNAKNVANALALLRPDAVDVSSGVESMRGIKDSQKITNFIRRVKTQSPIS